jgi:hypothetical protein
VKSDDLSSLNKKYPNAGAVYLLDDEEEEVFENGGSKSTQHVVFKILHERGKEEGNIRIFFNSHRQTASIVYARTITPEGDSIPLRKNAVKINSVHRGYPAK